jgi:hypothetical protein
MNLTPSQVKAQGLPENPRAALLKKITATSEIRDKTIVRDDETMPLTKADLRRVRHLVYYCPACKAYHFWDGNDFEDVEAILGVEVSNHSRYTPK